jgi:K+-sensing histidine kinase KdpD
VISAAVSRITGVRPAEPVPDAFVRSGEVKLVDLAPAALRRRLAQGLVVPGEQVDTALSNYFRFANLAALRELAQLWLDDSVPDPVTAYVAAHGVREMSRMRPAENGVARTSPQAVPQNPKPPATGRMPIRPPRRNRRANTVIPQT